MNATTATLPAGHLDLLDRPLPAVLTTHLADGRLQSPVVWYWRDADHLLLSTMEEFHKARNLRARPRATLLVLEPEGAERWIEVRGTVLPERSDAAADLDALAVRDIGTSPYFGAVVPAELAQSEHPTSFRLVPHTVVTGRPRLTRPGRCEARPRTSPCRPTTPAARRSRSRPATSTCSTGRCSQR
ncbi:pyridoxamine 5'-phosphate oxidase family protein [Cellulomonas sp. KRMCY2]|uniref:pyridoxamine 5'-phosphate oxidase family protein n=1 Tax=Cellulomonas sp. KRMCY2 TaxID=1304865 RepID=UPI00045E904F|nr:pyridoxamine 5'-phosphate oxidase family protein [Cellulomonas sp. KRMCY2]